VLSRRGVGESAPSGDRTAAMQHRLKAAEARSVSGPTDSGVLT